MSGNTPHPQRLAQFCAIVQHGSISKAALALGCAKSVLSRQLARLEAELGTRLVQRSTRRLALTEVGEQVFEQAQHMARALDNIAALAAQTQQEVKGRLRVTCPRPLGQRYLVPLVVEFTRRYPQVAIDLSVDDRMVDLIAEGIDVAIRVAHLEDSTLVARPLAHNPRVLVAAPAYLARAGEPQQPHDLLQHDCLVYRTGARVFDTWSFQHEGQSTVLQVPSRLQINDGMALAAAVCAGGGVAILDRWLVAQELEAGLLAELLTGYRLRPGQPIHAVYPARPWLAHKTAAFVAFLQERLFVGAATAR
ncbi:MAG: LysR substrate-binding domain-containing protein [Rhodoferax sp.]